MNPKVSVLMLAYDQKKYIAQAIESVLMQKTDFSWQLVIGEDYSTDGTREICQAYQERYPDRIRLLAREKNMGMAENFLSTFKECDGQYLAILEGDDFWVHPLKLQKQADFLDANKNFSLVFGRTEAFFQDIERPGYEIPPPGSAPYTLENLLRINFIATCSVMYRRGLFNEFPKWYGELELLDWPMHIFHAQHGKIGFIDELMAKYRIHAESSYSSRKTILNFSGILKFYRLMNHHLDYKYAQLIYRQQAWICREIANCNRLDRHWLDGLFYLSMSVYYYALSCLPYSFLGRIRVE